MKNLFKKTILLFTFFSVFVFSANAQSPRDTAAFRKNLKNLLADAKNGFAINQGEYVSETNSKTYQYYKCKLDLGGSTNIYTQQNSNDSGKVLLTYYDFATDALYDAATYTSIILDELNTMDASWKFRAVDYQEDNGDNVTSVTDLDFNDILEITSNDKSMTMKVFSKSAAGRKNNANSNINPIIYPQQQADVHNILFLADSKQFVVASAGKRQRMGIDFIMGTTSLYGINQNGKICSDYATISVACSPDGKKVLASIIADNFRTTTGSLKEFSATDTTELDLSKCIQNGNNPNAIIYSADGKNIITTSEGNVYFFEKATQKLTRTIKVRKAEDDYVLELYLINADKTLITFNNKLIQYWDVETGNEIKTLTSANGDISGCTMSLDKKTLLTTDTKGAIIWDAEKGEIKKSFEAIAPYCSAISPSGTLIVFGYKGGLYFYNNNGEMIKKIMRTKKSTFNSVAFSPDGKYLATGTSRGELVLFSVAELTATVAK